jgi:hypothetical protein
MKATVIPDDSYTHSMYPLSLEYSMQSVFRPLPSLEDVGRELALVDAVVPAARSDHLRKTEQSAMNAYEYMLRTSDARLTSCSPEMLKRASAQRTLASGFTGRLID